MKSLFTRNLEVGETDSQPAPFMSAGRACCCPASPAVTVLMPPSRDRRHVTELLLCGHHFRASQHALRAAGATVYDRTGQLVMGPGCSGELSAWDLGTIPPAESPVPAQSAS